MDQLWPGAKWWKFDFHTHTPASCDFQDKGIAPKDWLKRFMEKKIDCVAITDHNSGEWIDKLQLALRELEDEEPDFYHPLYLFPGAEISVHGGVHILAIFDPTRTRSDIDFLLGAIDYPSDARGKTDTVTNQSFIKVVEAIEKHQAIAIPAHVDQEKTGLFKKLDGQTLKQVLNSPDIHAMELCNQDFQMPQMYRDQKIQWIEICGSDTHFKEGDRFGHFTWIKMDNPSIEGLKLALMDGKMSVNRCMQDQPNQYSSFIIKEVTIENAKYMGRPQKLNINFSPFLNTIIGSRGSGKSTLIEFIRLLLRRDRELPKSLVDENKKYFQTGDENLLLDESKLSLIYRKDNHLYRLNWSVKTEGPSLEVWEEDSWKHEDGDIKTLFPVYIYSQKQIFALAQSPDTLLEIIDKDSNVKYEEWKKKHIDFTNSYKRLNQIERELNEKIAEESKLKGLLNDVTRQIEQIEKSGHKNILQTYRLRQRQLSAINDLEQLWNNKILQIQDLGKSIHLLPNKDIFDGYKDVLQAIDNINKRWVDYNKKLNLLDQEAKDILNTWEQEKKNSSWMKSLQYDMEQYIKIKNQLEQQNIDPERYSHLLTLQRNYQQELVRIKGHTELIQENHQKSQRVLKELQQNREQLTKDRTSFLQSILKSNSSVYIEIKPFGQEWSGIEKSLRELLQCADRFDRDFEFLRNEYNGESDKQKAIESLKSKLKSIYMKDKVEVEVRDQRFAQHIQELPLESINNLTCWFPKDALKITFGYQKQQDIQQGSPGQKTAALLAFILSYGTEPLLLDQPEDDLDNTLIYTLIVKQLRAIKSKRQVIVVTHNANIVVNGDAEMVFPLTVKNGQSIVDHCSSIQDSQIRERICHVLEGGQEAFRQRYKRIHLEQNNV